MRFDLVKLDQSMDWEIQQISTVASCKAQASVGNTELRQLLDGEVHFFDLEGGEFGFCISKCRYFSI